MNINLQTPVKSDYYMMFAYPPLFVVEYPHDLGVVKNVFKDLTFRQSRSNLTTVNQYLLDLPELSDLKRFCHHAATKYFNDVLHIDDPKITIQQSWGNKTPKGTHHPRHYHLNSMLSGVFYIDTGDESSPIVFDGPTREEFPVRQESSDERGSNEFMNDSYTFPAKEGILAIFPSSLHHYVPTNNTDKERISLSFNSFPELPVGTIDNSTYLTLDR